jgi:hypothetical protein
VAPQDVPFWGAVEVRAPVLLLESRRAHSRRRVAVDEPDVARGVDMKRVRRAVAVLGAASRSKPTVGRVDPNRAVRRSGSGILMPAGEVAEARSSCG